MVSRFNVQLVLGILLMALFLWSPSLSVSAEPMLPKAYSADVDVSGWWMSEKLDGVRGYWDGRALWSKNGVLLHPPEDFVSGLPDFPLEGELWGGRGSFGRMAGWVRRSNPHQGWQALKFGIFDAPEVPGDFSVRIAAARKWFAENPSEYAFVISQMPVEDVAHLERELDRVLALGAEGLIVRRSDALYEPGRSGSILKVKRFEDAEAVVVGHLTGSGRNKRRLGSLLVRTPEGLEFKIGSGFSDAQRESPPPPGAVISYRHIGYHDSGIPRFPVYLRIRADAGL